MNSLRINQREKVMPMKTLSIWSECLYLPSSFRWCHRVQMSWHTLAGTLSPSLPLLRPRAAELNVDPVQSCGSCFLKVLPKVEIPQAAGGDTRRKWGCMLPLSGPGSCLAWDPGAALAPWPVSENHSFYLMSWCSMSSGPLSSDSLSPSWRWSESKDCVLHVSPLHVLQELWLRVMLTVHFWVTPYNVIGQNRSHD